MSDRTPEQIFFELLVTGDNIEYFVLENFPAEALPTDDLRPIYQWCVEYFLQNQAKVPPTVDVLKSTEYPGQPGKSFYTVLNEYEIFLDEEPQESVKWVVDELKGRYISKQWSNIIRDATEELLVTSAGGRANLFGQVANQISAAVNAMEPRVTRVDFREDADALLSGYEVRKSQIGTHMGMHFGIRDIDDFTYGIHAGELAVLAAGPKTGKSFFAAWVALKEFEAGRSVALFTLENSIEMTENRIACLATGVNPEIWSKGDADPQDEEAVHDWVECSLRIASAPLHILKPDVADSSAESIVNKAKLLGVDSLIVDQLTFITHENPRLAQYLQIKDSMHTFKSLISNGHNRLPCLLVHQINREGVKRAEKQGHYNMYDMAEGSEVERTADWVFSMFQGPDQRMLNRVLMQTLATRRGSRNACWNLEWDISVGNIGVLEETTI